MRHTRKTQVIMFKHPKSQVILGSISLAFLCATSLAFSQELNVLVIGSTHSFSEGGEGGVVHEKSFNPAGVTIHLQSILAQDPAITDAVNVEFEDIYKTKVQTVIYSANNPNDFTSHCYSLAQHYMWPDGKAARLANLRGQGARVWDYIVLCNDPYIMANFPGMVAEGVKLIREEVAKSANPAQIVLLAQWPESGSSFTANQFNEIAQRVGNSAGLTVVPAGKAWDSYGSKDTSSNHPTPRGEYLAAASIYSKLFDRSAKSSTYDFPAVGDAIADHALSVEQANNGVTQYSGTYSSINPFQMKYLAKRVVSYRETGTSTEDRIAQALDRLDDVQRISFTTSGYAGVPGTRWDFNYGRGNDWWEPEKQYDVNSTIHDWVYGFPMHHYSTTSAPTTMPYGIDKHYYYATTYEDGTDLGIAYNMIRPGTREPDWPEAVRAIPIRLMWLKMLENSPGFNPLGDNTHMHPYLNDASAAFMYTLLSGRCPVIEEPAAQGSAAWMQWLGHKIGYETAWQMSHLTTRAPGFRVLPSATAATTITPTTTETMTVQFTYPPQADVTVTVSSSSPTAAIISPKTLVFTPSNYHTPQQVKVAGIPGATVSPNFNVVFTTSSTDEVYNGLGDSWSYTNSRSATAGLTQVDHGSSQILVAQNTEKNINLGVAGANAGNTTFAGPLHGSITAWQGSGVIQYTPVTGYTGTDQIVFAVTNGTTQTIGCVDISVEIPEGQVSANATDAAASEQGPDTGTFVISRLGDTGGSINVLFSLSGTATPGSDYTLSHTSPVTIPAGQGSVTLTLTPVDDSVFGEGTESAVLTITADAAYPIGTAAATITISDNDNHAPSVNAGTDQTTFLSSGTPWTPADISTAAWYDAADTGTITPGSGAVSQWNDKSGNGKHATQGTAGARPTSGTRTIGGKNIIEFPNTSSQSLVIPSINVIGKEVWSVFVIDDNASTASQLLLGGGGNVQIGLVSSTQKLRLWKSSSPYSADTYSSTTVPVSTPAVAGWLAHTNTKKFAINGVLQTTTDTYIPTGTLDATNIGRGQFAAMDGAIGEIVITNGTLSTDDRQKVEGYLAHKWGLTGNLPADHPHKAGAPGVSAAVATLDGTVTDADEQTPTIIWTVVSGPGAVTFGNANAIDTTASFSVAGVYTLRLTANDGIDQSFDEITITVSEMQTFSSWIGGFSGLGGFTAFDDDADGDGLKNGVEAFFGTAPNAPNAGLSAVALSGSSLTFTHPEADPPPADLTGSYEWSLDLSNWNKSGDEVNGTTVIIATVKNTPDSATTSVTATITGTEPGGIFVRAAALQD